MKKKSIWRARIIIAAILILIFGGLFLFFMTSKDKYGDYEYYEAFTTADKAHDIVLYKSAPLLYPLNDNEKYRIVCVDNSSGRETEYAEFDFEPCKGCGFSLKKDDGQKCSFVVSDCSGFRDFDIEWSEIFT